MTNYLFIFYIQVVFLYSTISTLPEPGDTGDGVGGLEGDDPAVSINKYLWVLFLVALVIGFLKFRNYKKSTIV